MLVIYSLILMSILKSLPHAIYNMYKQRYMLNDFYLWKGKPDNPIIVDVLCDVTSARIKWASSFDGGDRQTFSAFAYVDKQEASQSEVISDKGENRIHTSIIQNLQPATVYLFYVSAKNRQGTSSSETFSCKTLHAGKCFLRLYQGMPINVQNQSMHDTLFVWYLNLKKTWKMFSEFYPQYYDNNFISLSFTCWMKNNLNPPPWCKKSLIYLIFY